MRNINLKVIVPALALLLFISVGVVNLRNQSQKLQLQQVELQDRSAELKKLQLKYTNLNIQLEKVDSTNQAEIDRLEKEKQELEAERRRLEAELQAKLERKEAERMAQAQEWLVDTVTASQTASAAPARQSPTGTKYDWMRAAGIPESDWAAVDSIVQRESGWNPNAVNPSSGACGLGQQLPCGKWAGAWNDPVAALTAQKQYVQERYGGYWGAVSFWNINHWY